MRLRRETGDFQIKATVGGDDVTVNSIRPGLSAEDLIGEVVLIDYDVSGTKNTIYSPVIQTIVNSQTVTVQFEVKFADSALIFTYDPVTGAISPYEDGSD